MSDKKNKNHNETSGQISIFDLLGIAGKIDSKYSSAEIEAAIDKLREAKHFAKKREDKERRRKEQEERERQEREEKTGISNF
ncbi:MAG: hypothetical protein ACI4GA_04875 [Acutalibacteraceae bacterium]|nr:hypothetical protein [Oscillospiraceae bacterium]